MMVTGEDISKWVVVMNDRISGFIRFCDEMSDEDVLGVAANIALNEVK